MMTLNYRTLLIVAIIIIKVVSLASGQSKGHAQAIENNKKDVCSSVLDDPKGGVEKLRYLLNSTHPCCPCNPGERLVAPCRLGDFQSTVCEKCGDSTFMEKYAHEETVCTEDTRICPANQYFIPSIPTKDSRCDCRHGFKIKENDACRPHTKCEPGSGVAVLGTSRSDTTCMPCPHGYVSPNLSSTEKCQVGDSVRHHPKNKHLLETTDKPFAGSHGNLLHQRNTSTAEPINSISHTRNGTVPNDHMGDAYNHPYRETPFYQTYGFVATTAGGIIIIIIIGICYAVWKCYSSKLIKNCCWHKVEHDVEKLPLDSVVTYNANATGPTNQRTEETITISSEVPSSTPRTCNDDFVSIKDGSSAEESSTTDEIPKVVSPQVASGKVNASPKRLCSSKNLPTPSPTYCRRKQQKKKQHSAQDCKATTSETVPRASESHSPREFKHPANIFTSRDEEVPLLGATSTTKPASIFNQSHSPDHTPAGASSNSHPTHLMNRLKVELSTQISRVGVIRFYRDLSRDEFKEPVIEDLNRNNRETSEMFIAAFTKLMDQSRDDFNPDVIQRHFRKQNNLLLAHVVEDFITKNGS